MWNHQINVHALMRVCFKVCLYGAAQMNGCVQAVSAQFLPMPSHGWPNTGTNTETDRHTHAQNTYAYNECHWQGYYSVSCVLIIPLHSLLSDLSFFFF